MSAEAVTHWSRPSARSLIRAAAAAAVVGIGLSVSEYGDIGKWLAIVGVALLVVGLHRFGRMGPDAPIRFDAEPAPRKKKKKKPRAVVGSAAPAPPE